MHAEAIRELRENHFRVTVLRNTNYILTELLGGNRSDMMAPFEASPLS